MQGRGRGAGVARLQQRLGAATQVRARGGGGGCGPGLRRRCQRDSARQENARLRRTLRQAEAGVSQLQAELERLQKDFRQRAQRRTREQQALRELAEENLVFTSYVRMLQYGSRAAEEPAPPCPVYRLVLAGDSGTGKSSFLMRLCMNEFRDVSATLGVDFQIKQLLVDGEQTTLQIWDTAGQERYRSIAQSYFRKAHGVLLLYDISSQSSFISIRQWIEDIKAAETALPLMLVGNKTDLRPGLPEAAGVRTAHGQKLAMAHNCLFCETSAKDGTNVVEAVLHLAREVKRTAGSSSGRGVRLDASIPPPRAAPGCCRA
ncbi:ras and EF-hand domain-containing protein-like [Aythya fuligula]|uniref:Ras and EF-hand domain-containing protein-like n=1 Tax=Aythya fuligula TaxID=219594 RepID=A0A6J3DLK6_AYTFU|nr:ras and EF-hand domain-containing protein-like [Aythya fuligula]